MNARCGCSRGGVRHRERGAILVVSLLLLLVLTVLAVTSMRMATTQERLAGNVRDVDLSFHAAEAAVREAEERVRLYPAGPPPVCGGTCPLTDGVLPRGSIPDPVIDPAAFETFWNANAQAYGGAGRQIQPTTDDPAYLVEFLAHVPDALDGGMEPGSGRTIYRVVSRGAGGTAVAQSIIETTFARR